MSDVTSGVFKGIIERSTKNRPFGVPKHSPLQIYFEKIIISFEDFSIVDICTGGMYIVLLGEPSGQVATAVWLSAECF